MKSQVLGVDVVPLSGCSQHSRGTDGKPEAGYSTVGWWAMLMRPPCPFPVLEVSKCLWRAQ